MHITTKSVSSNPVYGEVVLIHHYVIKIVSQLQHVGGFLRVFRIPPPIKLTATLYNWNFVENGVKHKKTNKWFLLYCRVVFQILLQEHRSKVNNIQNIDRLRDRQCNTTDELLIWLLLWTTCTIIVQIWYKVIRYDKKNKNVEIKFCAQDAVVEPPDELFQKRFVRT